MSNLVRAEPAQVPALKQWSDEQIEMATRSFAKDCTTPELEVFAEVARQKGLDPWLGQIVAIKRGKDKNAKMVVQETVEGLRAIAERSGLYGGFDGPWWCGPDRAWLEYWDDTDEQGDIIPPRAARYVVFRKDWGDRPSPGVAAWASNVQTYWDSQARRLAVVDIWKARPDEMLAKCAETRALRRAFSKEFAVAGLSVRDLSDAQIVTLEAKRAGLDDDQRHAVIAEVTGGRTASSTDLTDDETFEVRQEIARIAAEAEDQGPEDAELVDDPPAAAGVVRRVVQAGPPGMDSVNYYDENNQLLPRDEAEPVYRAQRIQRVYDTRSQFSPEERRLFDTYRQEKLGVDPKAPPKEYTTEQLAQLDRWLDNVMGEPF